MQTLHGVALNVHNCGVLLIGKSGIGKSELGLELISRGHQLIADDTIDISKSDNQLIISNPIDKFFMHIRGIGFIDISATYTNSTLKRNKLDIIIQLNNDDINKLDPLEPTQHEIAIAETAITQFELSIGTKRPLALLVEIIVKQYQQQFKSNTQFLKDHNLLMQKDIVCNLL